MRFLLHLISVALVWPVLAIAGAFVLLQRAIGAGSLGGLLWQVLTDTVWLLSWGWLVALAGLLVVVIGGLFASTQWLAAAVVAILGMASTATVLAMIATHSQLTTSDLAFFVPGGIASGIGAWLAWTGRRPAGTPLHRPGHAGH